MELNQAAELSLKKMKLQGGEDCMASVSSIEAKEFNIEANKLTLLRTTFDQSVRLRTVIDQRQASISGNQISEAAIERLAKDSTAAAKASPQDDGSGFAPNQGTKDFSFGDLPANEEWMYSLLQNLLKDRADQFPKISLDGTIRFIKSRTTHLTSKGTCFTAKHGHYEGSVMFSAKDGKKASSFNYISFNIGADQAEKEISLMKVSVLDQLLEQASEQINVQKVPTKFDGEVIITPPCLQDFLDGWLEYLRPSTLLKNTSFLQNKLNEKVASPLWTLTANPIDSTFASRKFWTSDGYLTQNETIFENGILKNYLLNHLAAKKLNQKISASEGTYLKLQPGSSSLKEMISSVKKGILLCRYSAGRPAENGDISGVAKNSYFIENGEIKYPLGETMVALNLAEMLKNIQAISKETVTTGYTELPWVKFSGASVT